MTDYLVEFLETPLFKLGLTIFFSYVTWRLTEKLNPRFLWKDYKRRQNLKRGYINKDNVKFGIDHHDYFDHDDGGYIDDLITIRLDKTLYEYNFEEEFSQNCQRIPKLKLIKEYININFPEINLDEVVRTVIVPGVLRNSGDNIYVVNDIRKSRKDYINGRNSVKRLEASVFELDLVRMTADTVQLIDRLYLYFQGKNPDLFEINYKTNKRLENTTKEVTELIGFMTKVRLNGFIISTKKVNKEYQLFYNKKQGFSYGISFSETTLKSIIRTSRTKVNGLMLKEMLCKAVPSLEVREQQFTDIAISYLDGLYVEILGVLLVDNLAPFSDSDSVWLDFTLDSIRQEAFNKDSSLEHALSYAANIRQRANNNRFYSFNK